MTSLSENIFAANNALAPTMSLPTATCAAMPLGLPSNERLRATPPNCRFLRRMASITTLLTYQAVPADLQHKLMSGHKEEEVPA